MKKVLSFILALTMILCMSVTAFAAEGEQSDSTIVSVEVPDNTPSYTIHIPANKSITYNNTSEQYIGDVYVTDATNCHVVTMRISHTNLIDANGHEIKMNTLAKVDEWTDYYIYGENTLPYAIYSSDEYDIVNIAVQVPSWANAVPGNYSATITFNFNLD